VEDLRGREVEVVTAETVYRGVLKEVDVSEIYLISDNGWILVPIEKVIEVRLAE
jgi:hypothetical protein